MQNVFRRKPSASLIVAVAALVFAASGTAVAASKLVSGDKLIKKQSLSGNRLRDHTITGRQINVHELGTVPSATNADHATTAGSATSATNATTAGTASSAPIAKVTYVASSASVSPGGVAVLVTATVPRGRQRSAVEGRSLTKPTRPSTTPSRMVRRDGRSIS